MTDLSSTAGKLADLRARLAETTAPMGDEALNQRHADGRLSARERILELVDEGSFVEIDALARHRTTAYGADRTRPITDGVVTGYATIAGRKVCVYSQDDSIFEGALGEAYGEKMVKVIELATRTGVPLLGFVEGAGPRIVEGLVPLRFFATITRLLSQASGIVPHLVAVTGPTLSAQVFAPALADLVIMVDGPSALQLTPPEVLHQVTDCTQSPEELAGASAHHQNSGICHRVAGDDRSAIAMLREYLSYLPANNRAEAPREPVELMQGSIAANVTDLDTELDNLLPDSTAEPYDIREIISRLVDNGIYLEVQPGFADNIICAFSRVEGRSVGIVANQPSVFAGCLDSRACKKAARFIRTCDTFNIPIIEIVDVPGFLPAAEEETGGVATRAAALAYAFAEASVGTITVVVRRAMGAAYTVMGAKDLGADLVYAWPTAEIAAIDVPGATRALFADLDEQERASQAEVYRDTHLNPYRAAELGLVDAVIPPSQTRGHIVEGLRLLDRKAITAPSRKHGNLPL